METAFAFGYRSMTRSALPLLDDGHGASKHRWQGPFTQGASPLLCFILPLRLGAAWETNEAAAAGAGGGYLGYTALRLEERLARPPPVLPSWISVRLTGGTLRSDTYPARCASCRQIAFIAITHFVLGKRNVFGRRRLCAHSPRDDRLLSR